MRRVEARPARHPGAAGRRHAGRRVRTADGLPGARRDAVCRHAHGSRGRRAAAQGARDDARASRGATACSTASRKRALPRFPRVIAVVTSPDGAALHDIVAVARGACRTCDLVAGAGGGAGRRRAGRAVAAHRAGEPMGRRRPRDHRTRRRRARGSLGVQRRAGGARRRGVPACRPSPRSATRSTSRICDLVADIVRRRRSPPRKPRRASRAELRRSVEARRASAGGGSRALARAIARALVTAARAVDRTATVATRTRRAPTRRHCSASAGGCTRSVRWRRSRAGTPWPRSRDGATLDAARAGFRAGCRSTSSLRDGVGARATCADGTRACAESRR